MLGASRAGRARERRLACLQAEVVVRDTGEVGASERRSGSRGIPVLEADNDARQAGGGGRGTAGHCRELVNVLGVNGLLEMAPNAGTRRSRQVSRKVA